MKKFCIIFIVILVFVAIFICYNKNIKSETLSVIWFMGGPHTHEDFFDSDYLFEINTDRTIEIISGNVSYDIENKKTILGDEYKIRKKRINNGNWEKISDLVTKLSKKKNDWTIGGDDGEQIIAIINDKIYWTFYGEYGMNEELIELTEMLFEVCKIRKKSTTW